MRVVIVGVGGIGKELALNLSKKEDVEMVLIDSDEERCEELSDELDALVIHGDGTDPEVLEKAQLRKADALVATTDSDALNTVVAMLGKHFEVGKIIVKLNDIGLRPACEGIGVSKIIAPKIAAGANILSALYGSDQLDLSTVGHGGLRLIEFEVNRPPEGKLSELDIPEEAMVIAIRRGEDVLLPRKDTKVEKGDVVFVLVENEKIRDRVKKLLQGKTE